MLTIYRFIRLFLCTLHEMAENTENHHDIALNRHPLPAGHHRRPFRRGDFKYLLLQQIKEKPSCGYEIIRTLEERFHNFYSPSAGSVYPTLQMLEEMGQARSSEQDGKKVYSITETGLRILEEEKDRQERINLQMKIWCDPENAEEITLTMGEFEKLAGLVRDRVRNADTQQLSRMRDLLTKTYRELEEK